MVFVLAPGSSGIQYLCHLLFCTVVIKVLIHSRFRDCKYIVTPRFVQCQMHAALYPGGWLSQLVEYFISF